MGPWETEDEDPTVDHKVLDLSDQREQLKQKYTSTEAGLEYRKLSLIHI